MAMDKAEVRLRLVEALTRSDGSMARTDTMRFTQAVAQIENFVLQGSEPKEEPVAEKPKRSSKADKPVSDFMD